MPTLDKIVCRLLKTLFAIVIVAGCSPPGGGQTGDIAPPVCDGPKLEESRYPIDEVTPLGISGQEALGTIDGLVAALTWIDNQETDLHVGITHDAESFAGDCFHIVPFDAQDPACYEYIEVPAMLTLTSDDGRIDVELSVSLKSGVQIAQVQTDYYASDHVGDLDFAALVGDGWNTADSRVFVALEHNDDEFHGAITVITQDENTGEQTIAEIATW